MLSSPVMAAVATYALFLICAASVGYLIGQIADRREAAMERLRASRGAAVVPPIEDFAPLLRSRPTTFVGRVEKMISQAGLPMDFKSYAGATTILAIVMVGALALAGMEILVAIAAGLGASFFIARTVLTYLRTRREKRFLDLLPDALETIVRGLRVGHPVSVAIATVAREMPNPIGAEFRMIADRVAYTGDLEGGMRALYARMELPDLTMLVVAISMDSKTGGNLAELLFNLAHMLREKVRTRRKIMALSAEGRMSGNVLVILPISLFLILNAIARSAWERVWADPVAPYFVFGSLVSLLMGWLVIRRMVNFEI